MFSGGYKGAYPTKKDVFSPSTQERVFSSVLILSFLSFVIFVYIVGYLSFGRIIKVYSPLREMLLLPQWFFAFLCFFLCIFWGL